MTNYDKLINTLKEVFMLDKAELDFGIYRIMNQKRKDIEQFLEVDLVPQVHKVLSESLSVDKQALQKELDDAIKSAQALGADPNTLPKVQDLKKQLGEAADMVGIENEVFSLLANFFKRYFDNGDFISMRRYKKDVYAIPYEGEEVKLHWANADQYYIKTSEYFKVYRFKLENGKTVAFELIEASTEQNNNKTQGDKERRFAIYTEKVCEEVGDEFKIYFTYEQMDKGVTQAELLEVAFDTIVPLIPESFKIELLRQQGNKTRKKKVLKKGKDGQEKKADVEVPTEKLFYHLRDYTARNTFDYFIHKDLGGFLTRELDFYIKNEVLFIDDLNTRDEQEFLKQLSKIKAIKKIGEKIITFLAQLENFQKKLWLKKKIVVDCNYCITLDRVPKDLYAEIISNDAQIQEWIKLFAIDEIKEQAAGGLFPENKVGFSNPLTLEFLNQNQFLVLDTAFFPETFKWKLIGSIEKFDEQCDGLMINSENFQALNLLIEKYKNSVNGTYIDPPYNTGFDGFYYKDNFKDSSWLTMMNNVLKLSLELIEKKNGVMFSNIDENEFSHLYELFEIIFNKENTDFMVWRKSESLGKSDVKIVNRFKSIHENIIVSYQNKSITKFGKIMRFPDWKNSYPNPDNDPRGNYKAGIIGLSEENSNQGSDNYYTITTPTGVTYTREWFFPKEEYERLFTDNRIYIPSNGSGVPTIKIFENEEKPYFCDSILSGFGTTTSAKEEVTDILGFLPDGATPKPSKLIKELVRLSNNKNLVSIDFFSGTGTLGQSIIQLNREDIGNRKFILVEMGSYFNNVTKPRIQKAIYSKDWKDGKPLSREGISHCFKYMLLESYEDTLNNLALKQTATQQQALEMNPAFKEGYMLNYMLDVEAKESLLNLEWFVNPFNCYLNITKNNELQPTKVNLVETFNYLIGLVVENYAVPKDGYVVVTGKNLSGESILVVWRDCTQHDSSALNQFLEKSKYNPLDSEYDRIYVNGDNNVGNLKTGDERWKVVLIEEEFGKRMFENI
jgi:adenine-specific DNA-methyltransferase